MVMDDVLDRFIEKAPVAVMVRATLANVIADSTLDEMFDRVADRQYTKDLTFSTVVDLMVSVTFRKHESVHAAYRARDRVPVSVTAVYDKLNGLETGICEALVHETAEAMRGIVEALPLRRKDAIQCLRLRTLDGNFLAGTDHRLDCLRSSGAAALPGMSLVVRDDRTGFLTNLIPCEDAYTSERSLFPEVLALVQSGDLWLADRNFCTTDYMSGIAERQAYFLIRHHAGSKLTPLGKARFCGRNATGKIYEQKVRVGVLECRCIIVRLRTPLRDGSTEMRLLTNVPVSKAGAKRLAELYRTRWRIEAAFQELTDNLRCEVNTLGYPKAALFAFALAVAAYNLLMVIKAALASVQGQEKVESELSSYYLANEVAVVTEGLAIAVAENAWHRFVKMSPAELAKWLHDTAGKVNWRRYRKTPRGPKKPSTVRRTRRGAHHATARVLEEKRE